MFVAMNRRIQDLETYPMLRLDQLKAEVEARGQRVFDFGTGDPREPAGETGVAHGQELLESGILVSPGSFFGSGQEEFFRVALVPSLSDCKEAASLWPR